MSDIPVLPVRKLSPRKAGKGPRSHSCMFPRAGNVTSLNRKPQALGRAGAGVKAPEQRMSASGRWVKDRSAWPGQAGRPERGGSAGTASLLSAALSPGPSPAGPSSCGCQLPHQPLGEVPPPPSPYPRHLKVPPPESLIYFLLGPCTPDVLAVYFLAHYLPLAS